jgi:hypothetical protein
MRTAIVQTDAGRAYLKGVGNPEGLHALACEYVGTHLARLFGLKTLEFAIIPITEGDEIPLGGNDFVQPGPAYVTKALVGAFPWGGKAESLKCLENAGDIPKLVVFDTWLRNVDRCPPADSIRRPNYDNVLLSPIIGMAGRYNLFAIDHTHCISNGKEIGRWLCGIGYTKDDAVYGLFEPFKEYVTKPMMEDALKVLAELDRARIKAIIEDVPVEWDFGADQRKYLLDFIYDRIGYVSDNITRHLEPFCWAKGTP